MFKVGRTVPVPSIGVDRDLDAGDLCISRTRCIRDGCHGSRISVFLEVSCSGCGRCRHCRPGTQEANCQCHILDSRRRAGTNLFAIYGQLQHGNIAVSCTSRPSELHDRRLLSANVSVRGAFHNVESGRRPVQKEATPSGWLCGNQK